MFNMNPMTEDPFQGLVNALRKVLQSAGYLNGTSVTTTPPPAHATSPPPVHTASPPVNPAPSYGSAEDFYGLRLQRTLNLPMQPLWFPEESAGVAFVDSTAPPSGFKFGGSSSYASSGAFKFGGVPTDYPSTGSSSSDGFPLVAFPTPESSGERSESQTPVSGFQFGGSGAVTLGPNSTNTATTIAAGGLAFGIPKLEEKPEQSIIQWVSI